MWLKKMAESFWLTFCFLFGVAIGLTGIIVLVGMTGLPEWDWGFFIYIMKPMTLLFWVICLPITFLFQWATKKLL